MKVCMEYTGLQSFCCRSSELTTDCKWHTRLCLPLAGPARYTISILPSVMTDEVYAKATYE